MTTRGLLASAGYSYSMAIFLTEVILESDLSFYDLSRADGKSSE